MGSLNNFFYPGSICVVGASTKEKSIGYELLKTIRSYGYTGKVFPVNPKADNVLGYKCFHTIEEIELPIDLAILAVPKQFAEISVDSLIKKNVRSLILITAGFKEIGKEGEELEKRILEKIKKSGARMVGPNCMGLINTLDKIKLNATFVAEKPENGTTGFLSQSGALGAAVLNSLRETDIKFAHFISVGNKADINENDILHYWQEDENISTLTFYLESFVNGFEFVRSFITGEISKPAIVLKAGRTKSGMKAASSHTGALGGEDKVVNALLKQFGIIRADNLNELFNTAKGFENFVLPKGNRIAVITNAGGPAILCVDSLDRENLALAQFTDKTKKLLREIVHPEGSVENPVDLLPGGTAEIYKRVNEIVSDDENVDAVISIFVEPVMVSPFEVIEGVYSIKQSKPILQVAMPLPEFWTEYRNNSSEKLPLFKNPEDPAEVLSNILFYSSSRKKLNENKSQYLSLLNSQKHENSFARGFLSQEEISQMCNKYKIPMIRSRVVDPSELKNIEDEFYPAVLKGINQSVIHKTEINAIKLNIRNKDELIIAAGEINKNFKKADFVVEKFLVQQFVKTKHELLIGGFRDPSFGPIIMFGSGGKYVEVFSDTSMKSAYMCDDDIEEMINDTAIGKILRGVRGEIPCDINELKKIILNCARMMVESGNIAEFDLNPLIIDTGGKYHAVDIRVRVE
ncbi:MAG: acetyl-CoA synthetase [Ignavibacteriae bacterium HGW-Ignavibacteriae-3]|nr:MAG: acetyl-CoA synthetase [Ignavibacteriae bacterium HGW-Ignavibacteriae-3]